MKPPWAALPHGIEYGSEYGIGGSNPVQVLCEFLEGRSGNAEVELLWDRFPRESKRVNQQANVDEDADVSDVNGDNEIVFQDFGIGDLGHASPTATWIYPLLPSGASPANFAHFVAKFLVCSFTSSTFAFTDQHVPSLQVYLTKITFVS